MYLLSRSSYLIHLFHFAHLFSLEKKLILDA
jgi:hypothetical protein